MQLHTGNYNFAVCDGLNKKQKKDAGELHPRHRPVPSRPEGRGLRLVSQVREADRWGSRFGPAWKRGVGSLEKAYVALWVHVHFGHTFITGNHSEINITQILPHSTKISGLAGIGSCSPLRQSRIHSEFIRETTVEGAIA